MLKDKYKKAENALFGMLGPLVSVGGFPIEKKKNLCQGPSNEHSYQIWFQLAKSLQRRRLKFT